MKELYNFLKTNQIVFVTRDIERALGFDIDNPNYYIIANQSFFAMDTKANRSNILIIDQDKKLDTHELLDLEEVQNFINKLPNPKILVFKNNKQIEKICQEKAWELLNPKSVLAEKVEQKISQVEWLGNLSELLPPHTIQLCKNISFDGAPFVLQFNRSHTGSGTVLISREKDLQTIKSKFPEREARITKFINGPIFTNNNAVLKDKILFGNISYQITGLTPFTDSAFATIGNDWGLANTLLNKKQKIEYLRIANLVGEKLKDNGWKGLFGIDVVMEEKTGKMYLLEINARQPASTTFESNLETPTGKNEITTFEAHLAGLLGLSGQNYKIKQIKKGAQIILRNALNQNKNQIEHLAKKLCALNLNVIKYDNEKPSSDLLRIQTQESLMATPGEFNDLGIKIKETIEAIIYGK